MEVEQTTKRIRCEVRHQPCRNGKSESSENEEQQPSKQCPPCPEFMGAAAVRARFTDRHREAPNRWKSVVKSTLSTVCVCQDTLKVRYPALQRRVLFKSLCVGFLEQHEADRRLPQHFADLSKLSCYFRVIGYSRWV